MSLKSVLDNLMILCLLILIQLSHCLALKCNATQYVKLQDDSGPLLCGDCERDFGVGSTSISENSQCNECKLGYFCDREGGNDLFNPMRSCLEPVDPERIPSGDFEYSQFLKIRYTYDTMPTDYNLHSKCTQCLSPAYTTYGIGVFTDCPVSAFTDPCAPGQIEKNGECEFCEHGTCRNVETMTCQSCMVGTHGYQGGSNIFDSVRVGLDCDRSTGVVQCTICDRGKYAEETNAMFCTDCELGKYQNDSSCYRYIHENDINDAFLNCPSSPWQTCDTAPCHAKKDRCETCPLGSIGHESGKYCNKCDPGTSSNSNEKEWILDQNEQPMLKNKYLDFSPLPTECIDCIAGTFSADGVECHQCAVNEYSNTRADTCTTCEMGKTNNGDHTSCVDCAESFLTVTELHNHQIFETNDLRIQSEYGTCVGCGNVRGKNFRLQRSEGRNGTCERCEQGSYTNKSNALECDLCPPCPEQYYRTGCGEGDNSIGECVKCQDCDNEDEIRIDCKNREGHNNAFGRCVKKTLLTRTPECPRMNAFTTTFQTIGLGGYGYTDVFGVNENQTQFQCRQPCDSTTAVVNAEHVKQQEKLWDLGYGVVDSGYCTEAYACNTVSCLTQAANREIMACPQKIEDDDDATSILRKRGDSCVSCESCIGRGCVDCAQLLCDDGEVWDWTEDDLTFKCKKCSSLRNTNLCRNSNLIDFKPEHWPSGLIPIVKFDGCVGKNEQSLKNMTYGRCKKIDDVLTQTCDQREEFYSRSEGKCVSCLPRNTRMQEIVYQNSTGDQHRTYCQITGCKGADVTGVSKWGMLCTEECSEKTCQDTEQLVSCVVPHDTRCVSTHMPGIHRVGVSNFKRDFVPVHANFLEPIRVDEDTDFYFSSSFENHLITLNEYAENEFQCVWNARNIQDLNEIPGGNSRTFLAKSDVTSFERYDPEGTKKCRKWPAKGPYPMLPLQNSVRDVHSDYGLFLLNSSASVMSYRYEDEDGLFSTLKETKKKFSAHRLTGDLFLNIDMNSESQVNFMSFVRRANNSWVDKWEVSLLARDSSEPFHGEFLLEMALPTSQGDAMRAIQPQLLQTVNPAMPDNFISRLFCKNNNAELCFLHRHTPDFSGAESSLKFFRLLQDHQYVILQKYLAPSVHNFGTCDTDMKLFKHSSLKHLESRTSMLVKRNIAPTLTPNVLVGLVSDVHDFAACTANDVMVRCFRACKDGEAYEWAKDDAVIFDVSSHSKYLLVSTFDLNRIEYGYVLIDVGTGTEDFLGLLPNFKVFLSGPDSVWLLLRDFDTSEMSLQQFDLIASEGDVQVLSTENVMNLEWSVADTTFLSARSTLISQRDAVWLIMAPFSVDGEFEARLSIRVYKQDKPLLKLDEDLEEGNLWNFVKIQQSQSYLSHAWIHDSKVAVGYDEQVFILKFDFDKETISFQIASESNLQRHHFVGFQGGVITSEFVSPALSSQSVQNCYMGYVHTDSDKYRQIGVNIKSTEHHCYHKCDALESCDGIRVIQSSNATFCALYEFQSQMNHTGDIPSCIRDATYLQKYTLEFHQTQQEFETYVNVYSSKAAKSSGVYITSILHEAADLSSRGSGIDGFFAYDLKEFTDGDVADDVQVDHGKDFTSTKTLLTQYFPSVNTVDAQFKALPHFPYVHDKIDSDEVGLLSYTTPSHETPEFNKDLFLEIRVNTVEQDPWLAIIRLKCTADARVYMQKSVFESMAECTSEYAYLIVYYKESTLMFDYHNVQAFDARKRITHTDDYARVLLNFRTSLVFLQRMPHVPAAVFKDPETFLSKQAKATSLQRDWQIFRRTTSVKPENVSVSLINSQQREGSVAIDNMQVVPLLNVGIKSFEQIGDTRIQETEFYIPSLSELKELALEKVVTGDNLENWERMHVNFRVQTDTPGCEVEMRVLHVARDAEYHIGCRATADVHNETVCSVEVPTYFAENQDKQLPYVRTRASCEMQAVTVFFNPLSPMSTCTNLNQYYDYDRDLCVGCEYRVKICPPGMFMPGCDAFGHTAECQNCSGVLGSNEEFVQGDLVCQRRCKANYYRFEGECVPCGETLKNRCNATHRWQACTETEDEKCVECDPIIKSVFGGNEEYVPSEQGECVTRCKQGHWRDLSEPPFFCRPCRTIEEVLNGRDVNEFRIQNCTAFSDTLAVSCSEENDQTCGLPSSALHIDGCGICGGDNSTCMDCKGVVHGSSVKDRCGVCDGMDACLDCAGVPHGDAMLDNCGVCNGDNSCLHACGVVNYDDATFDRTGEISLGTLTYNIGTNGGFTIVTRIYPTNTSVDYETVFSIIHGTNNFRLDLGTGRFVLQYTPAQEGGSGFCVIYYSNMGAIITRNTWNTIIVQYERSTHSVTLKINDKTEKFTECQNKNLPIDDMTALHNYLGRLALYNPERRFHGKIGGIYFFDRHLDDEDVQYVVDGIRNDGIDQFDRSLCDVPVYDACGVRDGDNSTCLGCDGSFGLPVQDIQCHTCGGTATASCECDHQECGAPAPLFSGCPMYTECPTDTCARVEECVVCTANEVYNIESKRCESCQAGGVVSDGVCSACAAGKFSQAGETGCTDCPIHSNSINGATQCFCNDGFEDTDFGCISCVAGKHSEWNGMTETKCNLCSPNLFCPGDGTKQTCPGGSVSNAGSRTEAECQCVAGYGWDGEICVECKNGFYSDSRDREQCQSCVAGRYSTVHTTEAKDCEPCPANHFCIGDGTKQSCGENMIADEESTANTDCKCVQGYGLEGDTCVECKDGYFSDVTGRSACKRCEAGMYSSHHASQAENCLPCEENYFCTGDGSKTPCALNQVSNKSSATAEACRCKAGYGWEASIGSDTGACVRCNYGWYSDTSSRDSCIQCAYPHTYSTTLGAVSDSSCIQCHEAAYAKKLGVVAYNAEINFDMACGHCPIGKIVDDSQEQPVASEDESLICQECDPEDRTQLIGVDGDTTCTPCPAGTHFGDGHTDHDHDVHETGCYFCDMHTYSVRPSPDVGPTYCTACPVHSGNTELKDISLLDSKEHCKCNAGYEMIQNKAEGSDEWCKQCDSGKIKAFDSWLPRHNIPEDDVDSLSDECGVCQAGKTSNALFTACNECDAGKFSDPLVTAGLCEDCVASKTSASGAGKCVCVPGKYSLHEDLDTHCDEDNGWTWLLNRCVKPYHTTRNWASASSFCATMKAELVKPQSLEDNNDIAEMMSNYYWINANDIDTEGSFVTSSGNALPWTHSTFAPNNAQGGEDCVRAANDAGWWNDVPCSYSARWVCERQSCVSCDAGKFKVGMGNSVDLCTECGSGKYLPYTGATSATQCIECVAGKYFAGTGAGAETDCEECGTGKYSSALGATSDSTCQECGAGTYLPDTGATSVTQCVPCAAGKFSPTLGAGAESACQECSAGKYLPDTGATSASQCMLCAAGKFSPTSGAISETTCQQCEAGAVAEAGSSDCTDCGAGQEPKPDQSECKDCDRGKSALETDTVCVTCNAGYYAAVVGMSTCTPCEAGKHTNGVVGGVDEAYCRNCNAGLFSLAGAGVCTSCWYGSWSTEGSSSCSCNAGYEPVDGMDACKRCAPGTFKNSSINEACLPCPPGHFQELEGQIQCDVCHDYSVPNVEKTGCLCNAGYTQAYDGVTCAGCSVHTYKTDVGNGECTGCAYGKYLDQTHAILESACRDCEAGKYASNVDDGLGCEDCLRGTYSSSFQQDCTNCEPGKYGDSTGLSACKLCAAGTFAYFHGNELESNCDDCDEGKFSSEGASICSTCAAGAWSERRSSICSLCLQGFQVSSTPGECDACDAGKFKVGTNDNTCSLCESGTFQEFIGQTDCDVCQDHSVSNSERTDCLCNAGYASQDVVTCVACEENTYKTATANVGCTGCQYGKYSDQVAATTASVCQSCEAGKYSPMEVDGMGCDECARGKFSVSFGVSCENCAKGSYSDAEGAIACTLCAAGKSSGDIGANVESVCRECVPGLFSLAGATECSVCATGSWSNAGSSSCLLCEDGYELIGDTCTQCTPGKFKIDDYYGACQTCELGKFQTLHGMAHCDDCTSCPVGTACNNDRTHCEKCPDSYIKAPGMEVCEQCPSHSETDAEQSQCWCNSGYMHSNNELGALLVCTVCEQGKYLGYIGNTFCSSCAPGKYLPITGAMNETQCIECQAGKYSDTVAATTELVCIECSAGKFSVVSGATGEGLCVRCPAGKYSSTTGADSSSYCIDCDAGKYSDVYGAHSESFCIECVAGKYATVIGSATDANCQYCEEGKYSEVAGASSEEECILCAAGKYSSVWGANTESACIECEAGKYSENLGATGYYTCLECGTGKYSYTIAATSESQCTACAAGKFSDVSGADTASACQECPEETISEPGAAFCSSCTFEQTPFYGIAGWFDWQTWMKHVIIGDNCRGTVHNGSTYFIRLVLDKYHVLRDPLWTTNIIEPLSCNPEEPGCSSYGTAIDNKSLLALEKFRANFNVSKTYRTERELYADNVFLEDLFCYHPHNREEIRVMGNCTNCNETCPEYSYFAKSWFRLDSYHVSIKGFQTLFPTLTWQRGHSYTFVFSAQYPYWNGIRMSEVYLFTADMYSACRCLHSCSSTEQDNTMEDCTNALDVMISDWRKDYTEWRELFTYDHCTRTRTPCNEIYCDSDAETVEVTCNIPCNEPLNKIYYAVPTDVVWNRFGQIEIVDTVSPNVCTPCAAGYWTSIEGACTKCEDGKISTNGDVATCSSCASGQGSDSSRTSCVPCDAGKFSTGGTPCLSCEAGTYALQGASSCSTCGAGQEVNGDSSSCKDCAAGFFKEADTASMCAPCSAATVSSAGATSCVTCGVGTVPNAASTACVACGATEIAPQGGMEACIPCPDNSYASPSRMDCECNAGYYGHLAASSDTCFQCATGKFSLGGASLADHCQLCDAGKQVNSQQTGCDNCLVGKYKSSDQYMYCQNCEVGKYAPSGSLECYDCGAGLQPNSQRSDCENCPAGEYSTGNGYCIECQIGKYAESGASVCSDCAAGEEPNPGATDCQNCEAGKYSASAGGACSECAAGSFNPVLEIQCSSGCFFTYSTYYTAHLCAAMQYTNSFTGFHRAKYTYSGSDYYWSFTHPLFDCTMTMKSTGTITVETSDIQHLQYSDDGTSLIDTSSPITSTTGLLTLRMYQTSGYSYPRYDWEVTGATACTSCPADTTAPAGSTAASNCANCAAGKYAASAGSNECTECAGGSYNPNLQIECSPGCSYDAWHHGLKTLTLCNPIQSSNVFAGSQSYSWNPSCSGCIVGDYDCMITMKSTGTIKVEMTNHEAPLEYSTVDESSFISHGTFSWDGTDTATIVSNTGVLIMNPKIRRGKTSARYGFNWNWEITGVTTCLQCPAGTTSPAGSDSESDCV